MTSPQHLLLLTLTTLTTLLLQPHPTNAIFADEAGQNDFTIPTAGHGLYGVTHAHLLNDAAVLTFSKDDCYITSRDLPRGIVNWRRNICSSSNDNSIHRTSMQYEPSTGVITTVDERGVVRVWQGSDGSLLTETAGNIPAESTTTTTPPVTSIECNNNILSLQSPSPTTTANTNGTPLLTRSTKSKHPTPLTGWTLPPTETLHQLHLLTCTPSTTTLLLTTQSGTTHLLLISDGDIQEYWAAEEALGSVTAAIFLDVTHAEVEGEAEGDEEEEMVVASLSFGARLVSQVEDVRYLVAGGGLMEKVTELLGTEEKEGVGGSRAPSAKDYSFGLTKVAVLLSTHHLAKVVGIDTSTTGKGADRVVWTLPLDRSMEWHKIVHGATTGRSSVFGHGMHHPHSHEILLLSHPALGTTTAGTGTLEWHCVDGVKGTVLSSGTEVISSPVVQVLPIHAHSFSSHGKEGGGCRQNAILVHEDDGVSIVPYTVQSAGEVEKAIGEGLYAHTVDVDGSSSGVEEVRSNGLFRSMKIVADGTTSSSKSRMGKVMTIGETIFDPEMETILSVTYPQRNEVVQSPTTIVGDDSLLLKYLNPHLCVVVTEATPKFIAEVVDGGSGSDDGSVVKGGDEEVTEGKKFYDALSASAGLPTATARSGATAAKKPIGATRPDDASSTTGGATTATTATTPAQIIPTLFINLVDTVSGQIVYRVSHAHTAPSTTTSTTTTSESTNVPVVISENWVIYAFPNHRTRRTELGVLTLHEGMIDKHGITAFSSPTQQLTFSSMSSPKPIVLTKTFGIARPVSAVGVTNTRGGISSKSILLATGVNGQIVRVDRRLLDPRRPAGVPKITEKKEGLLQYAPLIPISPLLTPSYDNNVAHVTSIISTAANLESQTLMLAYGGPDIFFTRFAPSKGFDSLPASFNKLLLILVLLALFIGLMKAKSMSGKKAIKFGWS